MYSAIVCHIGPAPLTHETSSMADPSALPTHIPIMASLWYDTAQLSLKSVLVPVFTGSSIDELRILDIPKVFARFFGSLRAFSIRKIFGSSVSMRRLYDSTIFSSESSTVPRDIPYQ